MSDARRWLAEGAELPRELLRALRAAPVEPGPAELQELATRLASSLGVGLSVPAATAQVAGVVARGSSTLQVLGAWLVGGVVAGVGLSAAAHAMIEPDGAAPASAASLRPHIADARREQSATPGMLAPPGADARAALEPLPARSAGQIAGSARAVSPPETAIGEQQQPAPLEPPGSELSLLESAQAAMAASPAQALAISALHEQRFPSGLLAQEREVIAIDALLRLGRLAEARVRAERFEGRYPGSAHARRLQQLLVKK